MTQCLGRLVKDTVGVGLLSFEDGSVFHIPYRCERVTRNGDLCENCSEREQKTIEKMRGITGTTIKGMLPSYLNGRVTEPIPFWSRLYDGAWFRLKIEAGSRVSESVMAKARKAVAVAYEGVKTVEPQAMPGGRKIKTKKAPAEVIAAAPPPPTSVPLAAPLAVPLAVPLAAPLAVPLAAPLPKAKKRIIKPATAQPVAILSTNELPVEDIMQIHVRRIEVDGRHLYFDGKKEKLYDLKFKYLGRLKDGVIVPFPDSDADAD
jgi:hypothetical protein